jgi:DNA polymerase III delta subunit
MVIKSLSRDDLISIKFAKARKELKAIERELINSLKDSLESLLDLESLYEIRNHVDDLISTWKDKEIDLDDYDDGGDK